MWKTKQNDNKSHIEYVDKQQNSPEIINCIGHPSTIQDCKSSSSSSVTADKNLLLKQKSRPSNKQQQQHLICKTNSLSCCHHDKLIGFEMRNFIRNLFNKNLESLVYQWLPEIIIELNDFIQEKLSNNSNQFSLLSNKFLETLSNELNENFPFMANITTTTTTTTTATATATQNNNVVIKRLNKLYQNENKIQYYSMMEMKNSSSHPIHHHHQYSSVCYYWPNKKLLSMNNIYYELFNQLRSILKRIDDRLWKLYIGIELLRPNIQDSNQNIRRAHCVMLRKLQTIRLSLIKPMIIDNTWLDYTRERLNILMKIFHYPQIIDLRKQLQQFEKQQYQWLMNGVQQIMSSLLILHDLLLKNFDYIENSNSFYSCSCTTSTSTSSLFGTNSGSMMMFN